MIWASIAVAVAAAAIAGRWFWRRHVGDWFAPPHTSNWRDGQAKERAEALFDTDKLLALAAEFPGSTAPLARWTEVALGERNWPEVVRRAAIFREHFPSDIYGYLSGARGLSETGDHAAAEALLATAARKFPSHPRPLIDRAMVAQYRRDWPEARQRWQELQRRFPNEERPFAWEGAALMEMGELDAAETVLAAALQRFPANRDATIWYAAVAHRQGRWADAVPRWAQVRLRCDDRLEGYVNGAEALRRLGRSEEARAVLDEADIIFPDHAELRKLRALLAGG